MLSDPGRAGIGFQMYARYEGDVPMRPKWTKIWGRKRDTFNQALRTLRNLNVVHCATQGKSESSGHSR